MVDFSNSLVFKLRKTDISSINENVRSILTDGEQVISVYKAVRDMVIFTDKRVISVNIQGVTGKKQDITSMPYRKISVFSVETAGTLDLDSELEMYFSGLGKVKFEFYGSNDIVRIGQLIGQYTL